MAKKKKKKREREIDQQVVKGERWAAYTLAFWHIICEEFHELGDFAEGSYTSRESAAVQDNCSKKQPSSADYSWVGWGEKHHASIRCLILGNDTVELPRRPPGTLPREGAGGMDHWRTERTHGCPALAGAVRRRNKSGRHPYGELRVTEGTSGKELAQVRSNCRVPLMTIFSPLSPPIPTY